MAPPTITDWIQAITALLALVLAIISLAWQFRTSRAAKALDVQVEAAQHDEGVWSVTVSVLRAPRSEALTARLRVLRPRGGLLFNPDELPLERPTNDYFIRIAGPDFSRRHQVEKAKVLEQALSHRDPPSAGVQAEFGVELDASCEAAWLEVSVFGVGRRRPLAKRKMLVSPIA